MSLYNLQSFKVYFDSERIIELSNVDKDIIEKSIDDSNLLLLGVKLDEEFSYVSAKSIKDVIDQLDSNYYVKSVKSIFNERVLLSESFIPIPIKLVDLKSADNFNNSLNNIKSFKSHFISNDLKNLLFVIKCKNLVDEELKIDFINDLEIKFSNISRANINVTGQIKSEIYMKQKILNEIIIFIIFSVLLCSIMLWYFIRSIKLVFACVSSIILSICYSFSISNFLFGGIELIMIIIPAIIFIITISDFMHLLNHKHLTSNKYKLFNYQLLNIGKPVFLTSLTTAIGFLSFTFGSFEPLMRFGVVTTLSIFICLFIIVTSYALVIDLNLISRVKEKLTIKTLEFIFKAFDHNKKIVFSFFLFLSVIGILSINIDNFLTDEINPKSELYKEINYFEKNFGGIKPLSFSLVNSDKSSTIDFTEFLASKKATTDIVFERKDTTLVKARINDIGAVESKKLYNAINDFTDNYKYDFSIGGVGYLFDQISNELTYEVLIGLLLAIVLIGFIFVVINDFNLRYLFVSLIPNLVPMLSCLGVLSFFGFYLSLSNAFIFAIVFGLIVDDSIHIISAYSINRKSKYSIIQSITYCYDNTFHAVIKTTLIIIVTLIPLLFSEFKSISQLAYITMISALFALIFDLLILPILLKKFIK
ncbi:MAG: MMPL family transporter [Flavobacteriales bacterium]|nr:MMPL family transporter [Flavobacteriales bacterium]